MADQDEQRIHGEGIDHVKSNTEGLDTQNTSSGTAENSGVSNSSEGGGVVETVKSYLGMGSGTGTTAAETGQLGTTGDTKNAEDTTTGSGSGSGITGAAAAAASAIGVGSGNQAAGGGAGSTSSSSAPTGSTLETAKEKVQEVTDKATKEVTSGDNDHKPPQPADGKPKKLENEKSIPTAGGERLGEKHWGESKIVPDRPEPRASEAGISSEEGQPTQQTTDNTAKNTGGATGPPTGSSNTDNGSASGSSGGDGEEKTKMSDKIKDKLHLNK